MIFRKGQGSKYGCWPFRRRDAGQNRAGSLGFGESGCSGRLRMAAPPDRENLSGLGGVVVIVIRIGQLADQLGVHRNTIRNWIRSGKLPARCMSGKRYLVSEADFGRICQEFGIDLARP